MVGNLKKHLGTLYPICAMFLVYLVILMFSRVALSFWHIDRINAANGWSNILLSGLRIDIASICYLLILPALFVSIFSSSQNQRATGLILRVWFTLGLSFVIFMEIATPSFIMEYDLRPNRLFVEYLIYPEEVFGMLWSGYKLELLIGSTVSLATLYWGWELSPRLMADLTYPRWYWRPVMVILVLAVGVMGARSTLGHRPLNPSMVAFSSDPLINDLVLNSSYSMLFAVKQMRSEDSAFNYYSKMDDQEIIQLIEDSSEKLNNDIASESAPTLAYHTASYKGKPKNLVILLQESLGARYVGALGGLPLTSNLDKLMQEGWNFTRMYATGTRSVRGIEAVVTGFSPTPARSVVKLGKSQKNFFCIASLLKNKGYHTQFIYGGESHFDNMKSFFLGNGFDDIQDAQTFDNPSFVGSWGASDEDLYNKAHQQFTKLSTQDKPFFSLVFTSSNHSPYDFPDNRITLYNEPKQTRENAAKYSDYALGEFFKKAKKSNYWDNTVFVIVADHDSRVYGPQLVPIDHFHIPALILGKGITPKQDDRLASQIDLPPTMLSLIGISSRNPMIGFDMTHDIPGTKLRAIMQFQKNFAWMDNNNNVVILRPDKSPEGYYYDPKTTRLLKHPPSTRELKVARANALWGSLAYQNNYYQFFY